MYPGVDEDAFFSVVCKLLDWSLATARSRLEECRQYIKSDKMAHFTAPAAVTALARIQAYLFRGAMHMTTDVDTDHVDEELFTGVSDALVER